jgi:hypothetical protein
MRIAIIAWGSLIWDPRELPIDGSWQNGGPRLPLEFSRVSKDGRLTLVIDQDHGAVVDTSYAASPRAVLGDAIADLAAREGTTLKRIGFVDSIGSAQGPPEHARACAQVRSWLAATDFAAAIWTALDSNFESTIGRPFTVENAVGYLEALLVSARERALNYFAKSPREVDTPLRRRLVDLGWIEDYRAPAGSATAGLRRTRSV